MEQIPKIARQRLQVMARAGDHPDLNLLAAFAEKSLHGDEREGVLAHLAQCAECREVGSNSGDSSSRKFWAVPLARTALGHTGSLCRGCERGGGVALSKSRFPGKHGRIRRFS